MDKKEAKALINSIRNILVTEWDPIQIGENPKLHDEYDGVINKLCPLVINSNEIHEIVHALQTYAKEDLGLECSEISLLNTAKKLQKL